MKNIDFLPTRYREKTAQRKTQAWRGVVVAAFSALLAAGALGQYEIRRQIESHLSTVMQQHAQVVADEKKLAELQTRLREARAEAELLTYLRHPWPRTQILACIAEPLSDAITLSKLEIQQEESQTPRLQPALLPGQTPEAKAAAEAALPATERTLRKLRESLDDAPLTVTLEGTSADNASLHVYLGKLAESNWFAATELRSVERLEDGRSDDGFRFVAKLTVRQGYRGAPADPMKSAMANRTQSGPIRQAAP